MISMALVCAIDDDKSLGRAAVEKERGKGGAGAADVSHPGKVYWPDQGITKAELFRWYDRAAGWILPYLKDPPLQICL